MALSLLLVIAATDLLDGHLARRNNATSEFGYLLDGLGDRAVHVTAYLVLLGSGILPAALAWILIFREICQYGVRLAEPDWRRLVSTTDRRITKIYASAIYGALALELGRTFAELSWRPNYAVAVQLILGLVAVASYSRILPQLARAWTAAVRG